MLLLKICLPSRAAVIFWYFQIFRRLAINSLELDVISAWAIVEQSCLKNKQQTNLFTNNPAFGKIYSKKKTKKNFQFVLPLTQGFSP